MLSSRSIHSRFLLSVNISLLRIKGCFLTLGVNQKLRSAETSSMTNLLNILQHKLDSGEVIDQSSLTIEQVTWDRSSCEMVENITRGELVHPVTNVGRVKSRLCPNTRRVFALVHKEAPGVALGCIHVALTNSIPKTLNDIGEVDEENVMKDGDDTSNDALKYNMNTQTFGRDYDPSEAKCAIFYTISNLQPKRKMAIGPVGKILIMEVVNHLKAQLPNISTFCTLSPIAEFAPWLRAELKKPPQQSSISDVIKDPDVFEDLKLILDTSISFSRKKILMKAHGKEFDKLVMFYLTEMKNEKYPLCARDPVANFHLTNGATLNYFHCPFTSGGFTEPVTRQTWANSFGFMANYLYNLDKHSHNSIVYASEGVIDVDSSIKEQFI